MPPSLRRWLAALVVGALVVAACSGGPEAERAGTSTSGPTSTSTTGPGDADEVPTTVAGDAGPATDPSVPVPAPAAPSPAPIEPTPTSGAPSPPSTVPTVGAVGSFGPWYLGAGGATSVALEVRSQSGAEPGRATVDAIRSLLGDVSGKQISLVGGDVPGGPRAWTPDDLRAEADRTGPAQSTDAGVLTLLFVRGGLAGNDGTIGVAVRSDVAAIFSDRVDEAAGLFAAASRIERAVTTHEVGHLLGLVDLVLATGRADPEHPGHSPNQASVMYFAVESTLVGDILGGGPPVDFDEADRADLRAIAARSS